MPRKVSYHPSQSLTVIEATTRTTRCGLNCPSYRSPPYAALAGAAGSPSQHVGEADGHSHRLDDAPVHPVSASFPIIVQVIPSIPNGQMVRVQAPSVMAEMPDDLMAVSRELIADTVDEPISTILTALKPNLTRLSSRRNSTAILIGRSIRQQLVDLG